MNTTRRLVLILAAGCAAWFAGRTFAADYPSRPIRFVVPYVPSGAADIVARILAQKLGDALGATVAESGFPGYEANNWLGLMVPAGTPAPIILRLNREIVRIFEQPEMHERLAAQGGEAETGSSQTFADYILAEITKWAKVVKSSGAQVE